MASSQLDADVDGLLRVVDARYSNAHLRLKAVSMGNTPWSAEFMVAQMNMLEGRAIVLTHSSSTSCSVKPA